MVLVKSILASALVLALIAVLFLAIISSTRYVKVVSAGSNIIGANLVIPNTCIPELSATAVGFGSVPTGSFAPTSNAEVVTNFGNAGSSIFIEGSNWIYSTNSAFAFLVGNTLWNSGSGGNIGTQMTVGVGGLAIYPVNTGVSAALNGGTGTVYFGMNVPSTTGTGTYTATINVMFSC